MSDVRLIERWLPIAELSEESVRERRSMTALPPLYYLHVWWARRPMVTARAAVLASLLPADADRQMFSHVLGIQGDPVASRRRIDEAKRSGVRFEGQAYDYDRAFKYIPSEAERQWISSEVGGVRTVVDPTAGGGSIPFESSRLGFHTVANDLNPVSALILQATVDYPARFGRSLVSAFNELAAEFVSRRDAALNQFFPTEPGKGDVATNYLWSRTINCPYCDGVVPLSPNWRLAPNGTGVALRPKLQEGPGSAGRACDFEIVSSLAEQSAGTVAGGQGLCPFSDCGRVIAANEIKRQAQTGEMSERLFAVVFKQKAISIGKGGRRTTKWERGYRAPRREDDNSADIAKIVAARTPEWEAADVVPTERILQSHPKYDPRPWGVHKYRDFFAPRQLLAHAVATETYRDMVRERQAKGELSDLSRAAFVYLSISIDKMVDYNSRAAAWHSGREVMEHTFRDHAFVYKWSFAEMATVAGEIGSDWATKQTGKCLRELIDLIEGKNAPLFREGRTEPVIVTCGSGSDMHSIENASVDAVVFDPPYGANVMYAELSDFFYVWLKRTAGLVIPELFVRHLTDKDLEAVANKGNFSGEAGSDKLAGRHYEDRMAAIFKDARRVLKTDGIMTVMFTHKEANAWDSLTKGLMTAGFRITASWPVNTESESSLHIKDKAAANSTILLVCRPRPVEAPEGKLEYWEDVEPLVSQAVRSRVTEFQAAGIRGVDLALASFGPALEKFSEHWPLRRGTPRLAPKKKGRQISMFEDEFDPYAVTPEDALNSARREVVKWRLDQITQIAVRADLDPVTAWFVLAWDFFESSTFSYDEGLRLARAVGVDLDSDVLKRFAEKKGSDLRLWDSKTRAEKAVLGPADGSRTMLDALHNAAWAARSKSLDAARTIVDEVGLASDPAFLRALEAVLEVLPISAGMGGRDPLKDFNKAAGDDFEALENLRRLAFYQEVGEPEQLRQLSLDLREVASA